MCRAGYISVCDGGDGGAVLARTTSLALVSVIPCLLLHHSHLQSLCLLPIATPFHSLIPPSPFHVHFICCVISNTKCTCFCVLVYWTTVLHRYIEIRSKVLLCLFLCLFTSPYSSPGAGVQVARTFSALWVLTRIRVICYCMRINTFIYLVYCVVKYIKLWIETRFKR